MAGESAAAEIAAARRKSAAGTRVRKWFCLAADRKVWLHSRVMSTPSTRLARALVVLSLLLPILRLNGQITESPHTIAPGKILIEIDGIRLSMDRADSAGNTYDALAVGSTIVSAGITPSLDVQIGAELFLRETFDSGGVRDSHSGLGDLSFRMKWTFWRDEKFGAAAAVIPYVRFPSGSRSVRADGFEGGLIIPWTMHVGGGMWAGAMFQWDLERNRGRNAYDSNWYASAFAQRNLTRTIAVYAEATAEAASNSLREWGGSVGVGAWWRLTASLQLDYELLRGLNDHAAEWTHIARVNWEW